MSLFSVPQQQRLRETVTDAFQPDELAVLVRVTLGHRLDMLVFTNQPTPIVVDSLIQLVESRGWTEEFVRGVYEERKDNPNVRAFCEADARFVFTPRTATTDLAREVGSGLATVSSRLTDPGDPVRAVLVSQASQTLTDLGTQFTRLRKYKVLHDCLHSLQFKYAKAIPTELRVFREDQTAVDNLGTYLQEMADELVQARPECEGLASRAAEVMWLNVADESVRRMTDAVLAQKPDDINKGFKLLEGLLRVQPTRINELLTGLLEQLQLENLRETLRRLVAAPEDGVARAVVALGGLCPRLNRILADHKEWQLIDITLHQIDTELKLGSGIEQCQFLWSEVGNVLTPLLNGDRAAAWSVELRQLGVDLTASFGSADPVHVQKAFRRLFPRAMWFFYRADKELKELSDELDKIGDKLRDILREVGNGHA
jgi:hypothetical protein